MADKKEDTRTSEEKQTAINESFAARLNAGKKADEPSAGLTKAEQIEKDREFRNRLTGNSK